jgi:hypothetical protein
MGAAPVTLLTGLPRSGTTLICALLNEFADTVALAEPIALRPHGDRDRAVSEIEAFIVAARHQALTTHRVISKHVEGVIPDNWVESPSASPHLRKVLETRGPIPLNKPLSPNFYLIIKHPAEFSALADLLVGRYPLVALVRHPLAVLASWQTVDMPVNRGHMPMAEAFNSGLAAELAAIPDRLKRQIALMGWLLETYSRLPADQVFRYEDLIAAPRRFLARFTPKAREPERLLTAFDPASRYPGVDLTKLAGELLSIKQIAEKFYPGFEESLQPWIRHGSERQTID